MSGTYNQGYQAGLRKAAKDIKQLKADFRRAMSQKYELKKELEGLRVNIDRILEAEDRKTIRDIPL